MLDHPYVYLAATRLSAHRTPTDWAIVIETFGYSPRDGCPSLTIQTFGSQISNRWAPDSIVPPGVRATDLAASPHEFFRSEYPFDDSDWQDLNSEDLVAELATYASLRGKPFAIPELRTYAEFGIGLRAPPRVHVSEFCRVAAQLRREDVLATFAERRYNVPSNFDETLILDEWNHVDVGRNYPSYSESFTQIARVLVTGDPTHYRPSTAPNTHWKNWPKGGSL
jgi:hypothetical protein